MKRKMEMEIRGNGDSLANGDRKIKKCTRTVQIFLRQYIGATMHPASKGNAVPNLQRN
jgi:hypothetical protein